MALFPKSDQSKSNQVASIEAELAGLQGRRGSLSQKLAAATSAVERAAGDRQKFIIEGDRVDDGLRTDINVRLVAAQSAELGLRDAVGQLGAEIGDAERRLAAERDRVAREAAAKAINADADTLAATIAAFDQAGRAMVAALGSLTARLPGVDPNFVPRLSSVTGDLGTAARELVTVARAHAARVVDAAAPLMSPRPPEPPAPPPVVVERHEVPLAPTRFYPPLEGRAGEVAIGEATIGTARVRAIAR
jgi:cell division septum initiation protein DivIVA